MELFCGICLENLAGEPQIELPCHHFYHTECFLDRRNSPCLLCNQVAQETRIEETIEENTRVCNLFDTDEKVRTLLKNYKVSYSEMNRYRSKVTSLLQRKKEDMDNVVKPLLDQIKRYHQQKKQEVLQSQEYKIYKSKQLRCRNFQHRLRREYRITSYSFQFLRVKRGMKSLRRIPYSADCAYMVRRKLRVSAYFR